MRTISVLLVFIAFLFSCSGQQQEENVQVTEAPSLAPVSSDTAVEYYPGGTRLKTKGRMVNNQKEGEWRSWYEDGTPWSLTTFEDGVRNGKTITWFENGQIRYEGAYRNNKPSGFWIYYDEAGNKKQEVNYPE